MGGLAGADGRRFCIGETIERGPGVGRGRGCECVILSAFLREAPGRFIGFDGVALELLPLAEPSISTCLAAL